MKDQSLSGGMFLFRHLEDIIKRHWIFFSLFKEEGEGERNTEKKGGGRGRERQTS